jgi:hypothetical protein
MEPGQDRTYEKAQSCQEEQESIYAVHCECHSCFVR